MAVWMPEPKTRALETDSSGRPATYLNQYVNGHDLNVEMADHEM
jgi:hypothetical protein